ncbi:MAG: glycosyltransferase [Acidobacteriaceae bacterium]|nr:glycosyltransferase [Acidobacteriaceae bacterium]
MANIALVCPPLPGHLNPIANLGRALKLRGHSVTIFNLPALEQRAKSEGLHFCPVGSQGVEALARNIEHMARQQGLKSLKFAVECSRQISELLCEQLPQALIKAEIDLVLVDQNEPAGGTVAEHLGLPFVSICPSLPLNREPDIPPPFFSWPFAETTASRLRNRIGYRIADWLISPINRTINRYRIRWGLRPLRSADDSFSPSAQLCQMTPEIDFPRQRLPSTFHYLGPFCDNSGGSVPFPFDQLNGKPLIYASLGTLQDRNSAYFRVIAEACVGFDGQLVLSLGGGDAVPFTGLPGSPLVVKYAPQLEILERANLTITHAGLNTVMQSLMFGVPMVAIPITHDQPGIAARVRQSGTGEVLPVKSLTVARLRTALERVAHEPRFRARAHAQSQSIKAAGGLVRGVKIVEEVLSKNALRDH